MIQQMYPWQKEIKKRFSGHLRIVKNDEVSVEEGDPVTNQLNKLIRAYQPNDLSPLMSCRIVEDEEFFYFNMELNQEHPVILRALTAFNRIEEIQNRLDIDNEIDIKMIGGALTLKIPKMLKVRRNRKVS